jgi:CDP-glucose 4,6-dehydratase
MAVIDVVKQFSAAWPKARWEIDKGDHVHEAENLRLDCTKAANLLNWLPKISIQEGVELTVDWYRAWIDGANMREFTLHQICTYAAKTAGLTS